MQSSVRLRGIALLFIVNVMWGLSFIFSKTALGEGMPPMTLACLRYIMTALLLIPLCLKTEGGIRLYKWAPRALLSALLGVVLYYFLEYTGLTLTTASAASLIIALVPMMTLLARVVFYREKIGPARRVCVGLSLVGVYFVIASGGEGGGSLAGNLVMVLAALCWTGYILVTPRLMQACSSMRVTTWQAIAAAILLCPIALTERSSWVPVSPRAWLCIFVLAAVCSALCYVLYGVAIRSVDQLTVSLFININPIAACIGGALFLSERLTPLQLTGGALILLSLLADSLLSVKNPKTEA